MIHTGRIGVSALVSMAMAGTLLSACCDTGGPSAGGSGGGGMDTLTVEVVETLPHDTTAYTQGLEVHDGVLWESTGLFGSSTLRELDPVTGSVRKTYPLPDTLFGEGLTVVNGNAYQLTWRSGLVLQWDISDPVLQVCDTIETEGWGLCSVSDSVVVTSDGSSTLSFRDIDTFDTLRTVTVELDGAPLSQLNELEYHDGCIFANRYYSDFIYRIDPETGIVNGIVDASQLRLMLHSFSAGVLNGIAWDPERGAFLLTGKLWSKIFVVDIR